MKVYVLIVEDRHSDTDVQVFASADLAVARAKAVAAKYARSPEDIEERQIAGWIYFANYSCESDSVRVVEREVTDGPAEG